MFAQLDEMPRDDAEGLGALWSRLAAFLEVHAEAEEKYFYPRLLKRGKGNPDGEVDDEVEDAVIRRGGAAACEHERESRDSGSE